MLHIDDIPTDQVFIRNQKLDVLESLLHLGDLGGFEANTIARVCSAWVKFSELIPLLTNQSVSLKIRGQVYSSFI